MSVKNIFKENTPTEVAEAMMIPAKLTARQRKQADIQLAEHRAKNRSTMTMEQKLQYELLKLKFHLEDYINEDEYKPKYTFGYFLEQYLELTNIKKKDFAKDIQIHETLLSNILKDRREPNERIIIRLELHSNNIIPAIDWFKLLEKEKGHRIDTDIALRDNERHYVTRKLQLV